MADQLYLSMWFPNFRFASLPETTLCILRQFPFSPAKPGIRAAIVYPLNWSEANVYQRIYEADEISDGSAELLHSQLQNAVSNAMESLHEDYAYEFEVYWDLWMPADADSATGETSVNPEGWQSQPSVVRVAALGPNFDDAGFEQNGHVRIDLGLDTAFLQPEVSLDATALERVQENIARLLEMTARIEKHCNATSRLLWSEDESSLAQKLLDRLQKLN